MCKFMLDSNLIKKYFKAGLWSKIMLVVFTLVLAVGGIVGYFLHKNDNVYAANDNEGVRFVANHYNIKIASVNKNGKNNYFSVKTTFYILSYLFNLYSTFSPFLTILCGNYNCSFS